MATSALTCDSLCHVVTVTVSTKGKSGTETAYPFGEP